MNYRTPGVYVEEISKLPASVAQSETAIPVFIGYTEKTKISEEESLINNAVRIDSMMNYEKIFGGPAIQPFETELDTDEPHLPKEIRFDGGESPFLMHHALNLFFANGGGSCFVVSAGGYLDDDDDPNEPDVDELKACLDSIVKNDEITLVVIPEAVRLDNEDQYQLYEDVLTHCSDQVNRFGIFDVRNDDSDASDFREKVNSGVLDKGAAYYPHLKSTIRYPWQKNNITFSNEPFEGLTWKNLETAHSVLELQKQFERLKDRFEESTAELREADQGDLTNIFKKEQVQSIFKEGFKNAKRAIGLLYGALEFVEDEEFSITEEEDLFEEEDTLETIGELQSEGTKAQRQTGLINLKTALENAEGEFKDVVDKVNEETGTGDDDQNESILEFYSGNFTSAIDKLLDDQRLTMPPSPAIAGVYAKVDADRGVWKSPANVSLNRVSAPSVKLAVSENDRLNVDSKNGKSVNAIRAFPGKGTLVWGARTLDGNSSEWRYISVRRFFNMVEDSVKSASARFVFEPNSANTWVKVKAMIENFLTTQWRAGALMGSKPEEAFYVSVGLGETMDQDHINNGQMIVEIGMAVVRPAEFIVLRFSHKMMES
jgi:uncharacterized protein